MDLRRRLAAALHERLEIVADHVSRSDPEKHVERLRDASARVSHLQAELLAAAPDPQLAHFLQRGSYVKALEYLEAAER